MAIQTAFPFLTDIPRVIHPRGPACVMCRRRFVTVRGEWLMHMGRAICPGCHMEYQRAICGIDCDCGPRECKASWN